MAMRLSELARLVGGKLTGVADPWIEGAAVLADAAEHDVTLIDHVDKLGKFPTIHAAAAVVPPGFPDIQLPVIQAADVHQAFAAIVAHFRPRRAVRRQGISPAAMVSPSAKLANDVQIGPGAVIEEDVEIGAGCVVHPGVRIMAGCRIGAETTIYANAVLYDETQVADHCTIHAGAVIGCFGFGYKQVDGRHQLSAQLGNVRIESHVEVGANSTIDRGSYGATVIGEGTKIDNQVQIGHNCRIGRHNLICAQVGIAGSTTTGDYVVIAGQVGIRDHVHIGQGAVLGAMAGITNDVPAATRMIGIPATPEREQKVKLAALAKLPEMRKQLKMLAASVARLEAAVDRSSGGQTSPTRNEAA